MYNIKLYPCVAYFYCSGSADASVSNINATLNKKMLLTTPIVSLQLEPFKSPSKIPAATVNTGQQLPIANAAVLLTLLDPSKYKKNDPAMSSPHNMLDNFSFIVNRQASTNGLADGARPDSHRRK